MNFDKNTFDNFLREANTKPDYTTNAGSYYKDLARKQQLIELLSKKIWDYEQTLDLTLEDIEARVQQRFTEWDDRIEAFPENVEMLLQEWLLDGTVDHIINDTIFNMKADTSDVDKIEINIAKFGLNTDGFLAGLKFASDNGYVLSGKGTESIRLLNSHTITLTNDVTIKDFNFKTGTKYDDQFQLVINTEHDFIMENIEIDGERDTKTMLEKWIAEPGFPNGIRPSTRHFFDFISSDSSKILKMENVRLLNMHYHFPIRSDFKGSDRRIFINNLYAENCSFCTYGFHFERNIDKGVCFASNVVMKNIGQLPEQFILNNMTYNRDDTNFEALAAFNAYSSGGKYFVDNFITDGYGSVGLLSDFNTEFHINNISIKSNNTINFSTNPPASIFIERADKVFMSNINIDIKRKTNEVTNGIYAFMNIDGLFKGSDIKIKLDSNQNTSNGVQFQNLSGVNISLENITIDMVNNGRPYYHQNPDILNYTSEKDIELNFNNSITSGGNTDSTFYDVKKIRFINSIFSTKVDITKTAGGYFPKDVELKNVTLDLGISGRCDNLFKIDSLYSDKTISLRNGDINPSLVFENSIINGSVTIQNIDNAQINNINCAIELLLISINHLILKNSSCFKELGIRDVIKSYIYNNTIKWNTDTPLVWYRETTPGNIEYSYCYNNFIQLGVETGYTHLYGSLTNVTDSNNIKINAPY